jgi:CBS domain-containing protein
MLLGAMLKRAPERLIAVSEDTQLNAVYDTMRASKVKQIAVTKGDKVVGIIDYENLLDAVMISPHDYNYLDAKDVMKKDLPVVTASSSVEEVIDLMIKAGTSALPYVGGGVKGLVSRADLLGGIDAFVTTEPRGIIESVKTKSEIAISNTLVQKVFKLLSDIGI